MIFLGNGGGELKLWNKFRVSNIPSLIFIDANTGKVICRNGLLVIRDDPEGLEFPWGPRPFGEVVAGPLLRNSGPPLESSVLEGSHVGVYFSAHWCPPCRSLTRVLVESYRKIKEAGQKFEIVFVSADRSEESFKQYFSEMPWLSIPYADEGRRGITQGAPGQPVAVAIVLVRVLEREDGKGREGQGCSRPHLQGDPIPEQLKNRWLSGQAVSSPGSDFSGNFWV
ncbi:nucleoredoxin [Crotalus adamanteus]|uniref:Nucleoredoxin n=1 Tax=Crotalus adamanteus TaxID=8729 RepID=A0AAW1CEB1_CROAD